MERNTGMQIRRNVALILCLVMLLCAAVAAADFPAGQTGWVRNEDGSWSYGDAGGNAAVGPADIDGTKYCFDADGRMITGWAQVGGYWYYGESSGAVKHSGWAQIGSIWYYFRADGAMATGWQEIEGKWYWFGDNGAMAAGWLQIGDQWYYFADNGAMATGWQKIGSWYHFSGSGKMDTGWINDGGIWYYLDRTGAMATGWRQIGGAWYYFDAFGRMYSNAYIDQKYFVDENGRWDGVTISDIPAEVYAPDSDNQDNSNAAVLTFHQDGWYVARLEVQVWDKSKQEFRWMYSDSATRGQKTTLTIGADQFEINRVGYQIWFFGWNNDYMNLPWANTDYATDFTLSGYGDYPEFDWK